MPHHTAASSAGEPERLRHRRGREKNPQRNRLARDHGDGRRQAHLSLWFHGVVSLRFRPSYPKRDSAVIHQ